MESVIYNDDCFNKFASIPDKSVQLVVADLPYSQTALKWDCAIDLNKMWIELKRIGRENCKYVFFCTTKFGIDLILSNRDWFRYDLVWEKSNAVGFLNTKYQQLRAHEMIYVFHNSKKPKGLNWIYNPQMVKGDPYSMTKPAKEITCYGVQKPFHNTNEGTRHPRSVINHIPKDNRNKQLHHTAKPVALCEWLIKTYSNQGDMVMDFTMGSGSTIIACINTNRKYIGIEKEKDIFLTAEKRIEERLNNI
jgi:site-specific DNA-methyltransferase (adenine-specific)